MNALKNDYIEHMLANNKITAQTRKTYERIFCIAEKMEDDKQKDLIYFSEEEISQLLISFKANNRNTIESYARILSSYLRWALKNKLININILEKYKPSDFEKFLTDEEIYITENQLTRYENFCVNFQDAVILRLLFVGVGGKQLSEIVNLKNEDVDFQNKQLKLTNVLKYDNNGIPLKYTIRYISVDDKTLDLIKGAINENIYIKKNGEMEHRDNIRDFTDLVENEYVIRSSITKTYNTSIPADKFIVYRRLASICDSLEIDMLTTKFIQRSGMIYYAHLLTDNNIVTLNDVKIVADRFNVKSYNNLKSFIKTEKVKKYYN